MTTAKTYRDQYQPVTMNTQQIFTIIRASKNRNSFGLRGYWLLGPDNRVWSAANSGDHKVLDEVQIPVTADGQPLWELAQHEATAMDRTAFLEFVKEVQL